MHRLIAHSLLVTLALTLAIPPELAAAVAQESPSAKPIVWEPLPAFAPVPVEVYEAIRKVEERAESLREVLATRPLPRLLEPVPLEEQWSPTSAEISEVVERAADMGVHLTLDDVERAAVYLRGDDDAEIRALVAIQVGAIGAAMTARILQELAIQAFVCAVTWLDGEGEGCRCEGWANALLHGAVYGAVQGLLASLGIPPASLLQLILGREGASWGSFTLSQIVSILVSQLTIPASFYLCNVIGLGTADKDAVAIGLSDLVWDHYGDGFMAALSSGGGATAVDPADGIALHVSDGSQFTKATYEASDTVRLDAVFVPFASGTYRLRIYVDHAGARSLLDDVDVTVGSGDLQSSKTVSFTHSAASLLALDAGSDEIFRFDARLDLGASWSSDLDFQPGIQIVDPVNANRPPYLKVGDEISSSTLTLEGVYVDPDGDAPALLEAVIDGVPHAISATGDPLVGMPFTFARGLSDGVHSVAVRFSDGITPPRQTDAWHVRASSTPPVVELSLGASTGEVNEAVEVNVHVSDAAGPIANREVRLSSDHRSIFEDVSGDPGFLYVTDGGGDIAVSYYGGTPGEHTVLAQDVISKSYDYEFVELGGGGLTDWSMTWVWQQISSDAVEASYEAQVLIQYQGQNLDVGDYVYFAADHGVWDWERDQVVNNGTVRNVYTLTAAEAGSGDEEITLSLPKYGVELGYVTNLPVGPGEPLPEAWQETVQGTEQNSYSFAVAVSDDGRYLAHTSDTRVIIRNLSDLSTVRSVDLDWADVNSVDFSPDGQYVVTGDNDGRVHILEIATGNVSYRDMTDGSTAVANVDWNGGDRIALCTEGSPSRGFVPRVTLFSPDFGFQKSFTFSGVASDEDIDRVACNSATARCAMSASNGKWAFFAESGSTSVGTQSHPEGTSSVIHVVEFDDAGNRLLIAGTDNDGSPWVNLYGVSGSTLTDLPAPLTANTSIYAATFLSHQGASRLALGGDVKLEIFDDDGGGVLASVTDPIQGTNDQSYHLQAVEGDLQLLAAINNYKQIFYNLSDDLFGPGLFFPQPLPIPYRETTISLTGSVGDDPAGIQSVERSVAGGAWQALSVEGSGAFAFEVTNLPVGTTSATVRARDGYRNVSQRSVDLIRLDDTVGPLISEVVLDPARGAVGAVFSLSVKIQDLDAGVQNAQVVLRDASGASVAGLPLEEETGDRFAVDIDSSGVGAGRYRIDVEATDASPHANASTWTDAAILSICGAEASLSLTAQTVNVAEAFEACEEIDAGLGFRVGASGDVTFRAGTRIVLRDGFAVDSGGRFRAVIDPEAGID